MWLLANWNPLSLPCIAVAYAFPQINCLCHTSPFIEIKYSQKRKMLMLYISSTPFQKSRALILHSPYLGCRQLRNSSSSFDVRDQNSPKPQARRAAYQRKELTRSGNTVCVTLSCQRVNTANSANLWCYLCFSLDRRTLPPSTNVSFSGIVHLNGIVISRKTLLNY